MAETEDINQLIRELNEDRPPAALAGVPETAEAVRLDAWLAELVRRSGSDLLLVAGAPPSVRVDGRILALSGGPLSGEEIEEAVVPALPRHARERYRTQGRSLANTASNRLRLSSK